MSLRKLRLRKVVGSECTPIQKKHIQLKGKTSVTPIQLVRDPTDGLVYRTTQNDDFEKFILRGLPRDGFGTLLSK
jgi:hypothetical protein